jgi:hypothetical protein
VKYWIVKLRCKWEDNEGRLVTCKERVRAKTHVEAAIAALRLHKNYEILEVHEA